MSGDRRPGDPGTRSQPHVRPFPGRQGLPRPRAPLRAAPLFTAAAPPRPPRPSRAALRGLLRAEERPARLKGAAGGLAEPEAAGLRATPEARPGPRTLPHLPGWARRPAAPLTGGALS